MVTLVAQGYSQNTFRITNNKGKATIDFKLMNNLVVIPVNLNGVNLSFLLDTGVNKPILFGLNPDDSLNIEQREYLELRGLGSGEPIKAIKAVARKFRVNEIESNDLEMFIILDEEINFSPRLGIPIHGIIGYDVFKDFVVEMNYGTEKLKFHDPKKYKSKKCRKCDVLPLSFRNNKPYIDVAVAIEEQQENIPVKLLIDSGGSDALWLFEDAEKNINIPARNFEDFLGRGLNGSIYGKRTRVNTFHIGNFKFNRAKVSFPEAEAITFVKAFKERNGSIGGEILKRFNIILDYGNSKMTVRKSKYFSTPFHYNMSGIVLQHNGMRVVKELKQKVITSTGFLGGRPSASSSDNIVFEHYSKFSLVQAFEIAELRADSPAKLAGLKKGDVILKINGHEIHEQSLGHTIKMLEGKEGKRIRLKVDRAGQILKFEFRLKEVL